MWKDNINIYLLYQNGYMNIIIIYVYVVPIYAHGIGRYWYGLYAWCYGLFIPLFYYW